MTLEEARHPDHLLFHCVSGSHAYGTALPTSDRDTRGVFVLPKEQFYGLNPVDQVSDERNDHTFYELGRCVDLLLQNNPNMLELLAMPADCILHQHPLWKRLTPSLFLSKQCRRTFAGYALSQVRRARGLNKKILNPMERERKSVLDFCYVLRGQGSTPLRDWLAKKNWAQENCGLVNIPHFRDVYALYYDHHGELGFSGVIRSPESNEVALSSVPKDREPDAVLSFNQDGYQTYCKDYRQYWEWVDQRNEARYANTLAHGKRYDAKHMMHTFRLLGMAEDIARRGEIRVRRPERDFLLRVRRGEFEYEDLVAQAEARIGAVDELFIKSNLPDRPDRKKVERVLVEMRREWYGK